MTDVTVKASARFTNLVARRFPGFASYQQFTQRRIPLAVLERRADHS